MDVTDPISEARRLWSRRWGATPTPGMAAVTSIMRVEQILMTRLNAVLKPFDLTFPRYEALMILFLSSRGSMPLAKIGKRLQVHPTSVTSLIDGLERDGVVDRARGEPLCNQRTHGGSEFFGVLLPARGLGRGDFNSHQPAMTAPEIWQIQLVPRPTYDQRTGAT